MVSLGEKCFVKFTKKMSGLAYEFSNKEISPWVGLRLIEEVYRKTGLAEYLAGECPDLPEPGSNRGYPTKELIEGFLVSVILGAKRLAHLGTLRYDEVVHKIFGWEKGMASQSTFSRFFRKFDQDLNDKLFPALNQYWFDQIHLDNRLLFVQGEHHNVINNKQICLQ